MTDWKKKIAGLLSEIASDLDAETIEKMIEIPPESTMGDYAFPCFKLAKMLRRAPNLIAAEFAEKLKTEAAFSRVESAGAYVNFFLDRARAASDVISEVIKKGEKYGGSNAGNGQKVIVEYSSPNIAKPFHIGHIRTTVIGNSIYKIYDFLGYDTVRINHLGDYGTQFGKMIVAYKKWGNEEDVKREPIKTLLSYYVKFHEEAQKDPSLEDEARATFTRLENKEQEEYELWKWFRGESLKEFAYVYDLLGIEFDSYAGESFYSDKMDRVLDIMNERGILKKSEGAQIVDLEEYGMSPALIKKKDGSTLYITRDIAAALYRKEHYAFDKNIYVVASQQDLHFKQLFKIIELMGFDWADECVHVPFGMVSLEDGTLSTRKGKVVFLLDVLSKAIEKTKQIMEEKNGATSDLDEIAKQVGIGAVMFQELSNNRIKDYVFSWDKVLNFDGETGPYVQYTHARAASVLRKAAAQSGSETAGEAGSRAARAAAYDAAKAAAGKADMSYVTSDNAYELVKLIGRFPEAVEEAAEKYEPSVVTRHIIDVAQSFNRFYHDEHILVENDEEKNAKLALVYAAKQTIANGLALLGVAAPDKM